MAEQQMQMYGDSSDSGDDFSIEGRTSPSGSPRPPNTALCFEGPEKNLEMQFMYQDTLGCRAMSREMLDSICSQAQCCILAKKSNSHFDSYILSESSLFVYPGRIVMKTCGTTTLLRCVPFILSYAYTLGLQFLRVLYSRKNFTFPEAQLFPHGCSQDEWAALDRVFMDQPNTQMQKKNGGAFIVGPMHEDHWITYVNESAAAVPSPTQPISFRREEPPNRVVLNVMMFGLDREVARLFYRDFYAASLSSDEVAVLQTEDSGIAEIIPVSSIDAHTFEPCGYSMNGIHADMYQTIHVTPEEEGSYASYETTINYAKDDAIGDVPVLDSKDAVKDYTLQLVRKVVSIFKPERFMVTLSDCKQSCGKNDNVLGVFDDVASLTGPADGKSVFSKSFSSQVQMCPLVGCHVSNWAISS